MLVEVTLVQADKPSEMDNAIRSLIIFTARMVMRRARAESVEPHADSMLRS